MSHLPLEVLRDSPYMNICSRSSFLSGGLHILQWLGMEGPLGTSGGNEPSRMVPTQMGLVSHPCLWFGIQMPAGPVSREKLRKKNGRGPWPGELMFV